MHQHTAMPAECAVWSKQGGEVRLGGHALKQHAMLHFIWPCRALRGLEDGLHVGWRAGWGPEWKTRKSQVNGNEVGHAWSRLIQGVMHHASCAGLTRFMHRVMYRVMHHAPCTGLILSCTWPSVARYTHATLFAESSDKLIHNLIHDFLSRRLAKI
eukprot:1161082-Pelagomonas_calceolata.AAC.7